jgi:hypothetical protein
MKGFEEEAKPAINWGEDDGKRRLEPSVSGGLSQDQSLDDPAAYQTFVRSLLAKIEPRLATSLDSDVQAEMGYLTRLVTNMPRKAVASNRVFFELAFDLLSVEQPNLLLAKSIRVHLAAVHERSARGVVKMIAFICGNTPLNAAISALLTILVLSFLLFWLMVKNHQWVVQEIPAGLPQFSGINESSLLLLALTIHAALVGSIVSILARIQDYLLDQTLSPVLIYVSVMSKPLLSVTAAILAFSLLMAGVISFTGVDLSGSSAPYVAWTLGFLSGFSERFAQDFVVSASARFSEPEPLDLKSSPRSQNRG